MADENTLFDCFRSAFAGCGTADQLLAVGSQLGDSRYRFSAGLLSRLRPWYCHAQQRITRGDALPWEWPETIDAAIYFDS